MASSLMKNKLMDRRRDAPVENLSETLGFRERPLLATLLAHTRKGNFAMMRLHPH